MKPYKLPVMRRTRKQKVTFKAHGRRVTFFACTTSGRGKTCRPKGRKRSSASRRARGKALARKYGFVSKGGKLYRKSPRRGLIRVRH
jgi:hypothetical protein